MKWICFSADFLSYFQKVLQRVFALLHLMEIVVLFLLISLISFFSVVLQLLSSPLHAKKHFSCIIQYIESELKSFSSCLDI